MADPNEVIVTETGEGKFTQSIQSGNHILIADEPEKAGGNDKGPNPYGLLLAGLGACTSMTLRMYAARKDIPLRSIAVHLTHEKVYNDDLVNCAAQDAKLDLIHRTVHVTGELTPEQIDDLARIVDMCPVHKTLSPPSVIKTTVEKK